MLAFPKLAPVSALLALVIVLGSPLPVFSGDEATAPPRTKIKLLTPFGPKGLSDGLTITEKLDGKCFAASAASPSRPDAWRCSAANAILDPCFQRILGDEKQFACTPEGPWSQKIVLLTATEALPSEPRKDASHDTPQPWALELANGRHCSMFTGATAPVAGMRINYGCPGGFQVVGDIDRTAPVWRVFFQGEQSAVLEEVDVTVAWY